MIFELSMRLHLGSLLILGVTSCAAPQERPKIILEYEHLIAILGDASVRVEDRYVALDILKSSKDERIIPLLVEGTSDQRIFDPAAEHPSAGPDDKPYVKRVKGVCGDILRGWFIRNPRSQYEIRDWKAWWAANQNTSIDEIRALIAAQDKTR